MRYGLRDQRASRRVRDRAAVGLQVLSVSDLQERQVPTNSRRPRRRAGRRGRRCEVKNKAAQQLGKLGGKARSDAKADAARANGAKGGRPRDVVVRLTPLE